MRDQHRPKQDLINEVVALRKQATDLRDAMAERRRVEDALRHSAEQLRVLIDGSPVGLCLFRSDGSAAAANRQFAQVLGYDSSPELLSVANVLGLFASREEQARVVELIARAEKYSGEVLFRHKTSRPYAARVIGAHCKNTDTLVLVVLEQLSTASAGDRRSA